MKVSTRAELDSVAARGCATPGCTHKHDNAPLYLTQRCHPGAKVEATYHKGIMTVACAQCGRDIVKVEVAE